MRFFATFVLAVFTLGTLATEASALGKRGRKRGGAQSCGGSVAPAPSCCGSEYGPSMYGQPGYGQSMYGQPGYGHPGMYGGSSGYAPQYAMPAAGGYAVPMPTR